ncbi:MAG: hypothetical protein KGJ84_04305 [Elusimicrobia bacterium]|nr:hypothetical protein [Elusimicrobiota bacterium]
MLLVIGSHVIALAMIRRNGNVLSGGRRLNEGSRARNTFDPHLIRPGFDLDVGDETLNLGRALALVARLLDGPDQFLDFFDMVVDRIFDVIQLPRLIRRRLQVSSLVRVKRLLRFLNLERDLRMVLQFLRAPDREVVLSSRSFQEFLHRKRTMVPAIAAMTIEVVAARIGNGRGRE